MAERRARSAYRGQRQLAVVVVEHLEAVVAAIAQLVEPAHALRSASLCTPSPGKTRKWRAVAMRSSSVRRLLPHEIRELHEKDLVRRQHVEVVERRLGRERVERVDAMASTSKMPGLGSISCRKKLPQGLRRMRPLGRMP